MMTSAKLQDYLDSLLDVNKMELEVGESMFTVGQFVSFYFNVYTSNDVISEKLLKKIFLYRFQAILARNLQNDTPIREAFPVKTRIRDYSAIQSALMYRLPPLAISTGEFFVLVGAFLISFYFFYRIAFRHIEILLTLPAGVTVGLAILLALLPVRVIEKLGLATFQPNRFYYIDKMEDFLDSFSSLNRGILYSNNKELFQREFKDVVIQKLSEVAGISPSVLEDIAIES